MLTYQDFIAAKEKGRLLTFIRDAITRHRNSDDFKIAEAADEYDAQRNVTISDAIQKIYAMNGAAMEDFTSSNNRIASNFFRRLNRQRCTYSLGNGVTFDVEGVKEKLGPKFDTDLFNAAYKALKHGKSYGFWNVDRMHVFPFTQFVPFEDETDGTLRAGIRYWCIEWNKKPVYAVLYEEDGYTKYQSKGGKSGLAMEEMEPKRAYKQTVAHTEAGGDEVIGEENYGALPIVPLYANEQHQSTLVGMRAAIDAFDLIQSGLANTVQDCPAIYWLIGNALGMTDEDKQKFLDQIRLGHVAAVDTDNSSVTAYTQEIPVTAHEAVLNRLENNIYRDFGAFNPQGITSRQVTATEINAAYQPMDEEADAFEYQIIEFIQRVLSLQGLEAIPKFKRNRIINQYERTQMISLMADYLSERAILEELDWIDADDVETILVELDEAAASRTEPEDGDVV